MATRNDPPAGHRDSSQDGQDRVRRSVVQALRRHCPPWLRHHAEDLAQAALLRTLESLARSGEGIEGVPASYLQKAAYCAVIDEIRRLRARPESPLEESVSERVVHPAPRPDAEHEAREAGRAIRDCLARMVPPRRRAVTLNLQGHSVPQTAGLLGWTLKKTENLVYRGLADLRGCLRAKGIDR